jgi:hypothetical protein
MIECMEHKSQFHQKNHNQMSHQHIVSEVTVMFDVFSNPSNKAVKGYEDATRCAAIKGITSINIEFTVN